MTFRRYPDLITVQELIDALQRYPRDAIIDAKRLSGIHGIRIETTDEPIRSGWIGTQKDENGACDVNPLSGNDTK